MTDTGRKQAHCHHCVWHFSKNILQREDKAAWGSMSKTAQGTQNAAGAASPSLHAYSEHIRGLDSLGSPLLYPNKPIQKPVKFGVAHTHLQLSSHVLSQYRHHLDTLTLSGSFPLSSYSTKHCIYIETAGTKAMWVCWGCMHIQQLYIWKGQLPTLQLQGKFLSFVTGTRSALKEEFSKFIQALSGRKHDSDNAQPSQ